MKATSATAKTRRIELILRQIDSLPTLPSVATRLLCLTADDDAHASEVINLVSSDQALTAKIIGMCRSADISVRREVLTIEHAVRLLGFSAVRSAVLSVTVLDVFTKDNQTHHDEQEKPAYALDYTEFWRHNLAVGCAAELIVKAHPECTDLCAAEAFVCGLLHDIGKLALYHVLPKSYQRVLELTDLNQGDIAEFERRILGIDHHTAGKRLSEQWQLPHCMQDCIWLHGTPYHLLPRLEHQRMIGLISVADEVVRYNHLGYSGNFTLNGSLSQQTKAMGLSTDRVKGIQADLYYNLQKRSAELQLDDQPSPQLFMASIQKANTALARLNSALERRSKTGQHQAQLLDVITAFHRSATLGRGVADVLDAVAVSAQTLLDSGFYAMLYHTAPNKTDSSGWLICCYDPQGKPLDKQWVDPPTDAPDLMALDSTQDISLDMMSVLSLVTEHVSNAPDMRQMRLLALPGAWGTVAILLHDRAALPPEQQMWALRYTWGAAIAAACQHDGARRVGEQLAEANRTLGEVQHKLAQSQSMVRLGEMAAGAAHEMNNPLAVISGRSQLLAMKLPGTSMEQAAAQTIVDQAHKLSDLITSLRMFAEPPQALRRLTDINTLLTETAERVKRDLGDSSRIPPFFVKVQNNLSVVMIDPEQIASAVTELLNNALDAKPLESIQVSAKMESAGETLILQVRDDGEGMDGHTLSHATDPFFSKKKAGRGMGMGLARAGQWAVAHGGRLELHSIPGEGTIATLSLPLPQAAADSDKDAA